MKFQRQLILLILEGDAVCVRLKIRFELVDQIFKLRRSSIKINVYV
jgi:hypothetical protein